MSGFISTSYKNNILELYNIKSSNRYIKNERLINKVNRKIINEKLEGINDINKKKSL